MATKYKLTYFDGTGRAEPIRYLFAYAGQEYEDYRIKDDEWPTVKPRTPFGKLPVLEVDGKTVAETGAILRYLAKQFGLLGKNDFETFQLDSLVDTLGDFNAVSIKLLWEKNPEKIEAIKKESAVLLEKLDKVVADNPAGLLLGSQVTWADLTFAAVLSGVEERSAGLLKPYSNLNSLINKINSLPSIKAWLEKRPKSHPKK